MKMKMLALFASLISLLVYDSVLHFPACNSVVLLYAMLEQCIIVVTFLKEYQCSRTFLLREQFSLQPQLEFFMLLGGILLPSTANSSYHSHVTLSW